MNQDQTIALYESMASITDQMLGAARNGDWDALCILESDCDRQVRVLESAATATDAMDAHKRTLIEQILADNREIRRLTESRMTELSGLINQDRVVRQLSRAYGGPQTASE